MKRYLLLLLILSISLSSSQAQNSTFDILGGRKRVDLPFKYLNNFIVVQLMINNTLPVSFVFDTGAEYTIITKKEIAFLLQMRYEREFRILGADMRTELVAYLVKNVSLRSGDINAPNSNILVLDQDYFQFEEYIGTNIHGILGADFFRQFVVKINYQNKIITLFRNNAFKKPKGKYTEVPVDIIKHKPYIQVPISINRDSTDQMKLLLDTGASLALLFHLDTHESLQLPPKYIKGNIGMGLGGFLEGYLARIEQIELGKYSFKQPLANFQELFAMRDTSFLNGRNGIIGNNLLDRFTLIIDYTREKLYLKANNNYHKRIEYDRSGLILMATGKHLSTFIVSEVLKGSPAEEAGVMKGDEIKRLGWLSSSFLSLKDINRKLRGRKGKKIKLVLKRNGKKIKRQFRLRDLL